MRYPSFHLPASPSVITGYSNHPTGSGQPDQRAGVHSNSRRTTTGNGVMLVSNTPVEMSALSMTGFASAFSTSMTALVAQRRNMAVHQQLSQQILGDRARLSAQARKDMNAIITNGLNNFSATHQVIKELSAQHIKRFSRPQIDIITEALDYYQSDTGDNFLMNVNVMGFNSLESYLRNCDDRYNSPDEIDRFAIDFINNYSIPSDMSREDRDEIKTRITESLQEPTSSLVNYIKSSPRISDVPLIKGTVGFDESFKTKFDGDKTLHAILQGQAINFNAFLSTTSDYNVAIEFCASSVMEGLGDPLYTVNLTSGAAEAEILRRATLRDLENGQCDTSSILFYFKTHNVSGVSVNATKYGAYPDMAADRMDIEDEILLAPGHYLQPEQLVRCKEGLAVIGNLYYGR